MLHSQRGRSDSGGRWCVKNEGLNSYLADRLARVRVPSAPTVSAGQVNYLCGGNVVRCTARRFP